MAACDPPVVLGRFPSKKLAFCIGVIALYAYLCGCMFICRPGAKFLVCTLSWWLDYCGSIYPARGPRGRPATSRGVCNSKRCVLFYLSYSLDELVCGGAGGRWASWVDPGEYLNGAVEHCLRRPGLPAGVRAPVVCVESIQSLVFAHVDCRNALIQAHLIIVRG